MTPCCKSWPPPASAAARVARLPTPEEIGLAIPSPFHAGCRPRDADSTPLAPDAPWAEPTATHRLGLVVRAGDADRWHLPVEVELTLPDELAAKPVRAFLLGADGGPREVLAQLDATGSPGKSRLVLIVARVFCRKAPRRPFTCIWACPRSHHRSPRRASTRPGTNGHALD